ncbi:MAG: 3-hydroxyacyl-CoA dehydrogenase NAD-binding domain-containing protein, partial [Syntrophomonadaceae bacterium]|nr:3-hydroxyacyl-CoA dehydrogenase NAD-binding domain-containing protein [Syntrophomonadaceae bacterium]
MREVRNVAIKKIGVLGAGTMGAGIAQVCVEAGFAVHLVDIDAPIVDKALKGIAKAWAKNVEKGKLAAEKVEQFNALLTSGTDVADFKDSDIIIEAIIENIDIKKKVFKQLAEITGPECILATNTSALSI